MKVGVRTLVYAFTQIDSRDYNLILNLARLSRSGHINQISPFSPKHRIEFLSLRASKESVVLLLRRKREKKQQLYGRVNKVKMQREIDDDLHQEVALRVPHKRDKPLINIDFVLIS